MIFRVIQQKIQSSMLDKNMCNDQMAEIPRRRVYLLPNLLTTAALFCGFYSVVAANHGRFISAAIAIFSAMILDGLDGRVARMTNSQSEFGKQYDSISDMVCFGVAPSLVIYEWSLTTLTQYGEIWGKIGWLTAFVYTVCAGLRLARFNAQSNIVDKAFFVGLASPMAAAMVAGFVWLCEDLQLKGQSVTMVALSVVVTLSAGLLMVSNLRYRSFKGVERINQVSFVTIVLIVLTVTAIWIAPPYILFGIAAAYAVSAPFRFLLFFWRCNDKNNDKYQAQNADDPDNDPSPAETDDQEPDIESGNVS